MSHEKTTQAYPSAAEIKDPVAKEILEKVINCLQSAEELGGPEELAYVKLMAHVAGDCAERAQICSRNNPKMRQEYLPPILVSSLMLSMLIDLASTQVADIEEGIAEGVSLASENPDVCKHRAMVDLAESLYRQAVSTSIND